ncbi:variant erythrocyte surface antigen-1 family protein [Babesia divergens]|uniref:Variant erythrocyte surface antigen-1 family protein n=1 Tax=Babesia divergens TaxID=32595 RepID=A0AAD9G8H9_BABDI|nr:variant erythrocyte surface antigen-1 family protein [Babesia divergens]
MAAAAADPGLLRCPKNLKECIDWVLRATERDKTGSNNINNLKDALNAELGIFNNSDDLTQLVHGLCLFMGYPSCLCKPKKSVEESLKKISKELKEDLQNYKCLSNSKPLNLNCDSSCSTSSVVCKCCVLDCIREVQSSCECVKGTTGHTCSCSNDSTQRCCKDLLEKLKAYLSLLNLKADMETLCSCPENCCKNGECIKANPQCQHCKTLQTPKDYTVTGLGLLRPSPKRLAERLEGFFGDSSKKHSFIEGLCTCKCGSGSCCCLSCENPYECSKSCTCRSQGCSCASKLQPPQCPRKTFCLAIDGLKIHCNGVELTCCNEGSKCHCTLDYNSQCSTSGCCVVSAGSGNSNKYHSAKCMIRRIARFFNKVNKGEICSKGCCALLCVRMFCDCLGNLFTKGIEKGQDKCKKCNGKSTGKCTQGTGKGSKCCGGNPSNCASNSKSDPTCCQGCSECNAIKLGKALQELRFAGPCGQDLYRVLKDFLYYCRSVFLPKVNGLRDRIKGAKKKCVSGCSSSGTPCQCSSGSSCLGCKDLPEDLRPLLLQGYSSAYSSEASWASLPSSRSGSKCCGSSGSSSCTCPPSGCSSSTSPCDPSKCCPDCPQKKAAKIFLGFLPCLYYALKYLNGKCKVDWSGQNISQDSSLGRFFVGMGYELQKLDENKKGSQISSSLSSLFNGSDGPLEKLYNVSKNYFTSRFTSLVPSSTSSDSKPETVRDILLWLSGLPFTSGFKALLEHCKRLCDSIKDSSNPVNFIDFESSLYASCLRSPFVLAAIEGSKSNESEGFPPYKSEISKFSYPEDPFDLLEKLCEYTRKVFPPLKFLCMQCENDSAQGGWKDCAFGQKCVEALGKSSTSGFTSSSGSGCGSCDGHNTYLCTALGSNKDVHDGHCWGGECLGSNSGTCKGKSNGSSNHQANDKCKNPCPHPLLRFLLDGSKDLQNLPTPFKPPEDFPKMGFSKDQLPSPGWSGYSLFVILDIFVGDSQSDKAHPVLRDLLRFLLCLTRTPPETLGELFGFFLQFKDSSVFFSKLNTAFADYASKEPGRPDGRNFTTAFQTALEALKGSSSSHSGSHPYDLKSLYDCDGPKGSNATCGPYLNPLAGDVYNIFIEDSPDVYLSWICYLPKDFKDRLEEFQGEFLDCCSSGSSSCKFVTCPCILPKLYKYGFSFMSASRLNGKKCFDFITQLGKFVGNSTLDKLIEEIERFIWSIRFPFFLGFLYVWFFVLSYFCYAILIKLDTVHTGSHLHLPRSFKILPSTLFSDASSKLKDLSYFTL